MNGLFIFRRDLRLNDNTGLIELCKICKTVYCIFILDDRQISPKKNKYFTYAGMRFMLQSLQELSKQIPLIIEYGNPVSIIQAKIKQLSIDVVYANADYTPFSLQRDKSIADLCQQLSIDCQFHHDCYLNSPYDIKPYQIFTPYYNVAKRIKVKSIQSMTTTLLRKIKKAQSRNVKISLLLQKCVYALKDQGYNIDLIQPGGRSNGIALLKSFVKTRCSKYTTQRDSLTFETSRLSPHIKFGTLSIREVFLACKSEIYRKELYWRDFYAQVGFYFPHVFGHNFRDVGVKWSYSPAQFKKWCMGKTGIDIIDACMTQLNTTGFMHNRGRMIVANYLTRKLNIDWRLGERYFASKLVDYDPCSNNGGWQWASGTGADAQPLFRIFNPELQAKKFDPRGDYRSMWLIKS